MKDDGTEDPKKGTQLLDIYALEIQMYTEQRNNKKLKQLYQKALSVKSAIPHPRIMGIVRECGGKMHMADQVWADAATDFFEVSVSRSVAGLQGRQGGRQDAHGRPGVGRRGDGLFRGKYEQRCGRAARNAGVEARCTWRTRCGRTSRQNSSGRV